MAVDMLANRLKIAQNLFESGDSDLAEKVYENILTDYPDDIPTIVALTHIYQNKGDKARAEALQGNLNKQQHAKDYDYQLGNAYQQLNQIEAAITAYQQALIQYPNLIAAHDQLGNLLRDQGKLREALTHFQHVADAKPEDIEAILGLAGVYYDMGQYESAITYYYQALSIDAKSVEAHTALGELNLLKQNYQQGWVQYNWLYRQKTQDLPKNIHMPLWDGKAYADKTLLVRIEKDVEDALHFVRYLPLVKELGGRLLVMARPQLKCILQAIPCVDEIIVHGDEIPRFDYHISLLGLPEVFHTSKDSILAEVPYLHVDNEIQAIWQQRFDSNDTMHVGFCWETDLQHRHRQRLSCPLEMLATLMSTPSITSYSLQRGNTADLSEHSHMHNLGDEIRDFQQLMACIASLDLIITVDSTIAHIAGALGKRCYLLLPTVPDWRWQLSGDKTPWYPSIRLFRQRLAGEWGAVIDEVRKALLSS